MTLLKRVLAAVRSARPGATGQAVVTVTIQEFHDGGGMPLPWRTAVFVGTAQQVRAAQSEFFTPQSAGAASTQR